jgi:hypothetical protein
MTWLSLDSKMFLSVAYDATPRILYLRFRSGDVYRYFHFFQDDYQHFLPAESKGRHFLNHIRERFPYERMPKLHVA